jgi:hypothetical protein
MLANTVILVTSRRNVLTRTTRRNIPEDASLYSHRRENLKSYSIQQVTTVCHRDGWRLLLNKLCYRLEV